MVDVEGWQRDGVEKSEVHSLWSHRGNGLEVRVAGVDDGTWDVVLNGRVIANRDTPDEAEERARELMRELGH